MYPTGVLRDVTVVLKSAAKFPSTLNQGLQVAPSRNIVNDFASAKGGWKTHLGNQLGSTLMPSEV